MENLFEILVQRGALAGVEDRVIGEVRRSVGLICRDKANKLILRHGLQGVVQPPLISQRRDRVGGKLLSAQGACAVGRIDQRLVRERQELVVERVVQVCAPSSLAVHPSEARKSGRPTSPIKRVSPVRTA